MKVELARVEDAEEILALQKLAYRSEAAIYDEYRIPPLTQTVDEMRADFELQVFVKTVVDGRIVGSVRAYMKDGTCFVGRLIVHPDWQDQGLGTKLMGEIESSFVQARRYELFTGHRSERNLYLYNKLGYRPFRWEKISAALTLVYLEKLIQGP